MLLATGPSGCGGDDGANEDAGSQEVVAEESTLSDNDESSGVTDASNPDDLTTSTGVNNSGSAENGNTTATSADNAGITGASNDGGSTSTGSTSSGSTSTVSTKPPPPQLPLQTFTVTTVQGTVGTFAKSSTTAFTLSLFGETGTDFSVSSNAATNVAAAVTNSGCILDGDKLRIPGWPIGGTCVIKLSAPATSEFRATEFAVTLVVEAVCDVIPVLTANPSSGSTVFLDTKIFVSAILETTSTEGAPRCLASPLESYEGLTHVGPHYIVDARVCDNIEPGVNPIASFTFRASQNGVQVQTGLERYKTVTWTVACPTTTTAKASVTTPTSAADESSPEPGSG